MFRCISYLSALFSLLIGRCSHTPYINLQLGIFLVEKEKAWRCLQPEMQLAALAASTCQLFCNDTKVQSPHRQQSFMTCILLSLVLHNEVSLQGNKNFH